MAAKATVELASVGVTVFPSLKGMAKAIRGQVSDATKGMGEQISKEVSAGLGKHGAKGADTLGKTASKALGKAGAEGGKVASSNFAARMSSGIQAISSGMGRAFVGVARTFGRGISAAITGAGRAISSIGASMQNYVVGPAMAASVAMAGLAASAFKTGVEYNTLQQTSRAALKTLMGSAEAANEQMDKLNEFTSTSPFAKDVFIEAQQQLLAFNFAAEEVIPTLDAVQNAVASIGGSNQQIREVSSILAKIRASQMISFEDFNQLADRGINAPALLASSRGVDEGELRQQLLGDPIRGNDAIKALQEIIAEMAKQNDGAAAGVKDTWVGATDRIKAAWRDTGSVMATPFVDPMGGGIGITWANSFADSLRAIQGALNEFVSGNRGEIEAYLSPITRGLEGLSKALSGLSGDSISRGLGVLHDLRGALIPLGIFFATVFGSSLLSGIPIIGQLFPVFGPLAGLFLAVAAVSPELQAALGNLFGQLGSAILPILPVIEELAQTLGVIFTDILVAITPLLVDFVSAIPGLASAFVGLLQDIWSNSGNLIPTLIDLAYVIGTGLIDVFREAMPYIAALIPELVELGHALGGTLLALWEELAPKLPEIIETLANLASLLIDFLIEALPYLESLLIFVIENWEAFAILGAVIWALGPALTVFNGIAGLISGVTGAATLLTGALGGVSLGALGIGAAAVTAVGLLAFGLWEIFSDLDAFADGFVATFEAIGMGAAWLGEQLVRGIGGAFSWIAEQGRSLWGWLTDTFSGGGSNKISMTGAPRYANGGIVPATPGGRLIIAGEAGRNEAVVDEGLLNRQLAISNSVMSSLVRNGSVGGGVNVEKLEIVARENESNEELLKRVRRILVSPDLLAGY